MQNIFLFFTRYFLMILITFNQAVAENDLRIVSTNANITEIILALGAKNNLIALDTTSNLIVSDMQLPTIGYHRYLAAEGILSLKPTHVLGNENMGPVSTLQILRQAGIDVSTLNTATTVDSLKSTISLLANKLHKTSAGTALGDQIDKKISNIEKKLFANKSIAFVLNIGGNLKLAGSGTSGDAFIQFLGGENIAAHSNYQLISLESIISLNPSLILLATENHKKNTISSSPLYHIDQFKDKIAVINASNFIAGLSLGAIDEAVTLSNHIKNSQK